MTIDPPELKARLDFALDASQEASRLILGYYQADDLKVDLKRDQSPVTAADRGAEELLRARIENTFSGDGILGEEFGETNSSNGYRWFLDPVDGTKSFIHGVPLFGTLIGLEYQKRLVLGVCRFPALDEVVFASEDNGTWWQIGDDEPKQTRVTDVSSLSEAVFCTTTITGWDKVGRRDAFDRLCQSARLTRGWGDCYGHILVATGRVELMVDPELNPWDAAALVPILQEAGGYFIDWNGKASIHTGNGLSVNAALKDDVLSALKP